MDTEKIDLYASLGIERKGEKGGYLSSYRHKDLSPEMGVGKVRPAMLVIPGGGYAFVSLREGEPIALQYFAQGFDCFVLDYDIAPHRHYPVQILQAGMAMMFLRRNADKLCLDGEHIAAIGFSAGGHLCGCISLLWDDPALQAAFGKDCELVRPDASVYSYAVVSSGEHISHGGSFDNFCADVVNREDYSLEKKVRLSAKPSFLWANTEDSCVPVENSLLLYAALHKAGVPVEMHIYEKGWHGMSTLDENVFSEDVSDPMFAHIRSWLPLSFEFLKAHGFVVKNA